MTKTAHLGRSKPASLPSRVTVKEHFQSFHALCSADVWTVDGWLVTAVNENGTAHHLRRDDEVVIRNLGADELLEFKPTAMTKHYKVGQAST